MNEKVIRSNQNGLTILEVMLATTIFAMIMIICFYVIALVAKTYIKGVTETRVQATAQVIVNTIGDSIKSTGAELVPLNVSPHDPSKYGGWRGYCIAGVIYSFKPGFQLVEKSWLPATPPTPNNKSDQLLIRHQAGGDCRNADPEPDPITATTIDNANQELMHPGMRLIEFEISNDIDPYLYKISIKVVNGGDINNATIDNEVFVFDGSNIKACKPRQETCSVLSLTKEVYQRIQK